jgi:ABC-type bacteriocin/lantibiotic exporter with double-glycine peptidase domain
MFDKINYIIRKNDKRYTIRYLILFIFFVQILEIIGISSIPIFFSYFFSSEFEFKYLEKLLENYKLKRDDLLLILSITLMSIFIFKNICFLYCQKLQNNFLAMIAYNNSKTLYENYINKPYSNFVNLNSSILIKNIILESNQVRELLRDYLIIFRDVLLLSLIVILLLFYNFKITISLFVIFIIFSFSFYKFFIASVKHKGSIISNYSGQINKYLNQTFSIIRIIKLNKLENFFSKKIGNYLKIYEKYQAEVDTTSIIPKAVLETFSVLMLIIIINYFFETETDNNIILANLIIFVICMVRMLPLFTQLNKSITKAKFRLKSLSIVTKDLKEFKNKRIKKNYPKKLDLILRKKFNLELKKINYKFQNNNFCFEKDLNLKISNNEIIGIYGESGAGKTTLTNIIMGLLKPNKGEIYLNKKKITKYIKFFLHNFALIPQNIYLFDDTIRNNIVINEEKIDQDLYEKSLELSGVNFFLKKFNKGDLTKVGENGNKISGGQKQRIAIAQAIYQKRKIMIFDEPTSALDNLAEKKIIKSICDLKKVATVIIISHNKKVIRYCDKIINLNF